MGFLINFILDLLLYSWFDAWSSKRDAPKKNDRKRESGAGKELNRAH